MDPRLTSPAMMTQNVSLMINCVMELMIVATILMKLTAITQVNGDDSLTICYFYFFSTGQN